VGSEKVIKEVGSSERQHTSDKLSSKEQAERRPLVDHHDFEAHRAVSSPGAHQHSLPHQFGHFELTNHKGQLPTSRLGAGSTGDASPPQKPNKVENADGSSAWVLNLSLDQMPKPPRPPGGMTGWFVP